MEELDKIDDDLYSVDSSESEELITPEPDESDFHDEVTEYEEIHHSSVDESIDKIPKASSAPPPAPDKVDVISSNIIWSNKTYLSFDM